MINVGGIKRDLLLLGSLVLMVKVAMDRQKTEVVPPVLYAPAQQSIAVRAIASTQEIPAIVEVPTPRAEIETTGMAHAETPFEVHEANIDIITQIETAQTQINQLLAIVKPTTKQAAQLKSMQQRLTQLKREYKNTSPAIALLGPIGTAGIVIKENELEKSLLRMVNVTRSILHVLGHPNDAPSYRSISQGLEKNGQIIASLRKESAT